jgi:hypothetical protein
MELSPSGEATSRSAAEEFPKICGSRRFIFVSRRALHCSLSRVKSLQSIPLHPISLGSILVLSSHLRLGLPNSFFPYGFPTEDLHIFLFSPMSATYPALSYNLIMILIYSYVDNSSGSFRSSGSSI